LTVDIQGDKGQYQVEGKTYKVAKISGKLEDWEIFRGNRKLLKKL